MHQTSTSGAIDSFTYTYDNVDNRLTKTEPGVDFGYTYDTTYRLQQSLPSPEDPLTLGRTTEDFTYDQVGNRLTGPSVSDTYAYGLDNRLESAIFNGYAGIDESFTYSYDYENRLTSVVKFTGGDMLTITFKYGPFGRRIEKHVEGTVSGVSVNKTYTYVYDGEDVVIEYLTGTEGGNPVNGTTRYVHGPGIDEPLSIDRDGVVYYYHADGLGSVVALTDASEAVAETYKYTPFGAVERTGSVGNTFTYTGREWDEETGLYYYRARYYDPEVGRFIGKDPIGFAGGDVNLYGYVGNNPGNWVDPWGLNATTMGRLALGMILFPDPATTAFGILALFVPPIDASHIREAAAASAEEIGANYICKSEGRKRGKNDPIKVDRINPGRGPDGKCRPCPPDPPPWSHPGNAHGSTGGSHWHWIKYEQNPSTCECYPKRRSGPDRPY